MLIIMKNLITKQKKQERGGIMASYTIQLRKSL